MDAHIVLGCHGQRRFGLSMCRGTTNEIVDLRKLGTDYEEIINHLDKHYKLFDKVIEDLNQVGNLISFLGQFKIVPEHILKFLHTYIATHRGCGVYIYVEPIKAGGVNG